MNGKRIIILLIGLSTINLANLPQNSFIKIYKSPYGEWGWDVLGTHEKGYIIVGQAYNANNYDDIYAIKTNNSGDTLWTKLIGDDGYDYGYSINGTNFLKNAYQDNETVYLISIGVYHPDKQVNNICLYNSYKKISALVSCNLVVRKYGPFWD